MIFDVPYQPKKVIIVEGVQKHIISVAHHSNIRELSTSKIKSMKLLYGKEHLNCINYDPKDNPTIERINMADGEILNIRSSVNKIVIVTEGKIMLSFGTYVDRPIMRDKLLFLPQNREIKMRADQDTEIVVFRLNNKMQLCECYQMEKLVEQTGGENGAPKHLDKPYTLKTNKAVNIYLKLLECCMGEGLKCKFYLNDKIRELFYLLRAFYPKRELNLFFQYAISADITFSEYVIANHRKYTNIGDLAMAMNYSTSGFQKRFKKAFKESAYHWMKRQKAQEIFHQLCISDKSLKEISSDFGFSSSPQFNDFVKNYFGKTPGEIQKTQTSL